MSLISKEVKNNNYIAKNKPVVNFMGGISYELNALDTLKMVTASSIFGEPQYYRDGHVADAALEVHPLVKTSLLFDFPKMKTSELMENIIDAALEYDFEATIRWAEELRYDYYMRLNPQIIMVRAATHPARAEFSKEYPKLFRDINKRVMRRADEPSTQLAYYVFKNKNKAKIPSILKRSWADRINNMSRYEIAKYKNAELGLINTIRICHAKGTLIDELMTTGTMSVDHEDSTWETLRSSGMTWINIIKTIHIPHMALLRNLRNIFEEINDTAVCKELMEKLKSGVLDGKQFPFRYWSAMKAISESEVNHKVIILDTLEECMDIARENMPMLEGRTMCLSDNSGSAWGTFSSDYGSVTIAEIDNLSSVITAQNSDEGYVGKFGDRLVEFPISKRNGTLIQADAITKLKDSDVGGSTENGIWEFFKNAIDKKIHWDNIFIYSDQQAGHGGLYGTGSAYITADGVNYTFLSRYIDVMKLINAYRSKVNPKANIFVVQTAGYNNVVVPEYIYRGAILYGWTGKETLFAKKMIDFWDAKESQPKQ